MKIGTKSLLFGAHQFVLHPLFVALAWWRLYGFPWDARLWVAFFVHDLGYWGLPDMDGEIGETHPRRGAYIMGDLFDARDQYGHRVALQRWFTGPLGRLCDRVWGNCPQGMTWFCFAFYHSRFLARHYDVGVSRLCAADKLAIAITPRWLYLVLANLSGEISEYMHGRDGRTPAAGRTQWEWITDVQAYLRAWVDEHRDGRPDYWTGTVRDEARASAPPASCQCQYGQHEGEEPCVNVGRAYYLEGDAGEEVFTYYYCGEHAHAGGFCRLCGQFCAGTESFDFDPSGLCSQCRSQVADEFDDRGDCEDYDDRFFNQRP